MKVSELEGAELDYWVLRALGVEHKPAVGKTTPVGSYGGPDYEPSSDWSQGGPLIEEWEVNVGPSYLGSDWAAHILVNTDPIEHSYEHGSTPLEAACRSIVASVYGDQVPEE